jgi:paraquat-inducible protein B
VARGAHPALIGAFVLGAVALAVIGMTIIGSGALFRSATRYVMYFPGSVEGLEVGAPVKFKGVEIGRVREVRIHLGAYLTDYGRIPVLVDIDDARVIKKGGAAPSPAYIRTLVDQRGLRAQLQPESLVTGLLFVEMDLHPGTPIVTVLPPDSAYPEIPTIPSTLAQAQETIMHILAKLEKADVDGLLTDTREAVADIHALVTRPALLQALDELPRTVADVHDTVIRLRHLATDLDRGAKPLVTDLRQASSQATATLEEWRGTAQRLNGALDPDSKLVTNVTSAVEEVTEAARAVRVLADALERNPGAILRGREVSSR